MTPPPSIPVRTAVPAPLLTLTLLLATAAATGGCQYTLQGKPPTNAERADSLARGVALASGGAALPGVRSIGFTFVVREGDAVRVARTHLWDLRAGTDTVSVGDRTMTLDLKNVDPGDAAQADAIKAWNSDTFWLAAPLKLFDPGVRREYLGRRDVAGKAYEVLGLSFDNAPDRYNLYVDPYTSLVAYWDHLPDAEAAADTTNQATWEQYRHPQGLVLSTFHRSGPQVITIENLSVAAE